MDKNTVELDFWEPENEKDTPEKAFVDGKLSVHIEDLADVQAVQKKLGMIFPREKNMYVGDLRDSWNQWGPELCVWRNGGALCFGDVYEAEAQIKKLPMEAVKFAHECYGMKMCGDIPTGEDKRKKILEDAVTCVCTDRNLLYGEPEDSFRVITAFWREYLTTHCMRDGKLELEEIDSKNMMILFKMARITTAKKASRDSYVDLCGYAAIAGEEVSE